MRYVCLLIIFISANFGELHAQGSQPIPRYRAILDSCRKTAEPTATFKSVLAPELAKRRKAGPIDSAIADHYYRVSSAWQWLNLNFIKAYADTAINLRIEANDITSNIAQAYYARGVIFNKLGQHQKAFGDHQQAVTLMSKAITARDSTENLARRLAYFFNEAAYTAKENGNYELANLWLQQVPLLMKIKHSGRTEYNSAIYQADVYAKQGLPNKAIEAYERAEELPYYKNGASKNGQGPVHANRAMVYNAKLDLNNAIKQFKKGIALFSEQEYPNHINIASGYSGLIRSYNLGGDYDNAQIALTAGLEAARKQYSDSKGPVIGELYARAATTASLQNNFKLADSLLRLSAEALLEQPHFHGPADLPILEGATMYGQEDVLEMLTVRREVSIRAYEQRVDPKGLERALAASQSIDTLLRFNRDQLNLTTSLGQFISLEAEQYTRAVDLALKLYRGNGQQRYLNEAYQFASSQKSNLLRRYLSSPGLAASLGVPASVIQEKSELELRVMEAEEALKSAPPGQKAALRSRLLNLNTETDELRHRITATYPDFTRALRGLTPIDPQQAANEMEVNQLLVEYFLSADSIYLFTLRNGEGLSVHTQARPDDLSQMMSEVVHQGEGAKQLYDLLVAPVLASRSSVTRLQFIPDGELWSLPFGALRTPGERFLIEEKAVSLAYAAPLLFGQKVKKPALTAYQGFGISYEGLAASLAGRTERSSLATELQTLEQLPFARREVVEASSVFGGKPWLEEAATKSRFIKEAGTANILHLSMHGLLRYSNPLESALVFRGADEYVELLTMREVLGGQYPAELTVLSACHTGGGPLQTSEGIQTIGRAFTAAGSQATITSAWAARDEVTYNILGRFFAELKGGRPKDLALQDAIKGYLKEGTKADRQPEFWANLALTGIVDPVDSSPPQVTIWLVAGVVVILCLVIGLMVRRKST